MFHVKQSTEGDTIMSFNMPITVSAEVDADGITQPNGSESVELGSVLDLTQIMIELNANGDMPEKRCRWCLEDMDPDNPTHTTDSGSECGISDSETHEPEWSPLTWAKNIAIDFDEENDQIDLTIATGDPRGGWQFRLRRTPDGVILMHLPHADMSGPHEPLREIHPGTFAIG